MLHSCVYETFFAVLRVPAYRSCAAQTAAKACVINPAPAGVKRRLAGACRELSAVSRKMGRETCPVEWKNGREKKIYES